MALTLDRSSLRLFGVDLMAVPAYLREGWAEALHWPAFRWLTPDEPVRVIHADGTESVRQAVTGRRIAAPTKVRFCAIELAEETVLRRVLVLPSLSEEELRQAVELDVHAASPFPEQDVVWGFRAESGTPVRVEIALTSRRFVEQQIEARRPRFENVAPEVWVGGERPFVIPGYGEAARLAHGRRLRLALFGLLSATALLLAALAITPTLQLRERALEAAGKSEELLRAVKPQAQVRDELVRLSEQLRVLEKASEQRHDVVALIDQITRQLPDDAVLTRLEIAGGTVRLSGQADNAAQLLQTLGAKPAFRDVRAPSGISRGPAGGKEGFTIEFRVAAEGKE
jgi:general secretion pathway protein L